MMKKLVSLVLALMLCLSCVSALAAEAWTVTCPWAPSGVAAMVNQKAASLSTTYSQDYVLVANAEKGDTATINSWLTKYTEADPQMCFIGEGMFGITAILDPERMNFTYDDFDPQNASDDQVTTPSGWADAPVAQTNSVSFEDFGDTAQSAGDSWANGDNSAGSDAHNDVSIDDGQDSVPLDMGEDLPSMDDEDIETTTMVGVPVVLDVLGGKIIETIPNGSER